jgi:hypothetical protein
LTRLIAECANQPLQVEVQEVRINPSDFGTASDGMAGGGYGGYGGGGYGGYGGGREGGGMRGGYGGGYGGGGYGGGGMGAMGGGSAASLFPERSGLQYFPAQPHIANVVIQGIIYIFKEPDDSLAPASEDAAASEDASVALNQP